MARYSARTGEFCSPNADVGTTTAVAAVAAAEVHISCTNPVVSSTHGSGDAAAAAAGVGAADVRGATAMCDRRVYSRRNGTGSGNAGSNRKLAMRRVDPGGASGGGTSSNTRRSSTHNLNIPSVRHVKLTSACGPNDDGDDDEDVDVAIVPSTTAL